MSEKQDDTPGPLDKTSKERQLEKAETALNILASLTGPLGGVLGALIQSRIPNIRLERVVDFTVRLGERFDERMDDFAKKLEALPDDSDFIESVYESVRQASATTLEVRREYLARLMAEHLDSDDPNHEETALILAVLEGVTDYEFLHLVNFARDTPFVADEEELSEFRDRHDDVLEMRRQHDSSPSHERNAVTVQEGHYLRLLDKGLLRKKGGSNSRADFGLSDLGTLVLTRLGILRDPDAE